MGLDISITVNKKAGLEEKRAQDAKIYAEADALWKDGNAKEALTLLEKISHSAEKTFFFRKVNSLVAWVERLKGEVENCETVELSFSDITELQSNLDKLLSDKTIDNAEDLFPTMTGFFFGSVAYDDTYFSDVLEVKQMCDFILNHYNETDHLIEFCADW